MVFIMNDSFELLVNNTLKRVVDSIKKHENRIVAPLSIQLLTQVKKELEQMIIIMNPRVFMPNYPRFILDWPDEDGLIEELINIAYQYKKIKI